MPDEAPETIEARSKIQKIYTRKNYDYEEEIWFPEVTNYIGEKIDPPYQVDILVTKQFAIELDPQTNKKGKAKGHGTKIRRTKDKWRDINFREQILLKTVRLIPDDVNKQSEKEIIAEVESQLGRQKKE